MKYWCGAGGPADCGMYGAPPRCFNACIFAIALVGGWLGGAGAVFVDEFDAFELVLFRFALDFFDPLVVCFWIPD